MVLPGRDGDKMPETTLAELLERNAAHANAIPPDYFSRVESHQEPAAVSVCCADSRVSQEGMWSIEEPGWLFTPSTIGNQVWDSVDGELVVDGSVLYPIRFTNTKVTVVVGHTGCGAITAALQSVNEGDGSYPTGVEKWVNLLKPVVQAGLGDESIDTDRDDLVNQLVEYNVDTQVSFLLDSEDMPADETVFGFVYDFQGVYGDRRGMVYLVNADGVTDIDTLRSMVPTPFESHVKRLT